MKDSPDVHHIEVSIAAQELSLCASDNTPLHTYPISSARNGTGCEEGSYCTPLGQFTIYKKIGGQAPKGTIFKGRQPTGLWQGGDPAKGDLILSRILWLDGTDAANANTRERYIYIHGTNHEALIGEPASEGCLRMRNEDVIDLYDRVSEGTPLTIS